MWPPAVCHGRPRVPKAILHESTSNSRNSSPYLRSDDFTALSLFEGILCLRNSCANELKTDPSITYSQYHPGGDPKNPPKDAPSALHSVIVPNVNLPKASHLIINSSCQISALDTDRCSLYHPTPRLNLADINT